MGATLENGMPNVQVGEKRVNASISHMADAILRRLRHVTSYTQKSAPELLALQRTLKRQTLLFYLAPAHWKKNCTIHSLGMQ